MADTSKTPGILRRQAFAGDGVWAGAATTEPGAVSAWHHHGDHTTYLFVASGRFVLESGPAGRDVMEATAGDFVTIPARAIHRESNPTKEEQKTIIFRVGSGPVSVNVRGPEPAEPGSKEHDGSAEGRM